MTAILSRAFVRYDRDFPLTQIRYRIGITRQVEIISIVKKGASMLLVKSDDGKIDKLITDHQLKGINFLPDGEIIFDGRGA